MALTYEDIQSPRCNADLDKINYSHQSTEAIPGNHDIQTQPVHRRTLPDQNAYLLVSPPVSASVLQTEGGLIIFHRIVSLDRS